MNKKKHNISKSFVALSFLFFGVFVLEGGFILGAIAIMEHFNILSTDRNIAYVIASIIASITLGSISTFFINKYTMKSVDSFKEVIVNIANGDFSGTDEKLKLPLYKDISAEFNKMIKEINSSYILKQDFVDNVSHELKTPLVSILGYAELLKDTPDLTKEEKDQYLDIIISEVKRLSNISSSAMLMSKLDSSEIIASVEAFNVNTQIEECVLLLDGELKNKNISTTIELENVKVSANKDLLKEVWLNLLSNAIKYSPPSSSIDIKMEITNMVRITISDNGIGMSEEEKSHIFEKYYRAKNDKKIPGIGLGLSIAKRIIELSNGFIECASVEGVGTSFIVSLPRIDY